MSLNDRFVPSFNLAFRCVVCQHVFKGVTHENQLKTKDPLK